MAAAEALIPKTYRQVRRQMCLGLLRAFVRRWGTYLAIVACIAGSGAPAVAVWSVLPLFWALDQWQWFVPVLLLYAAMGTLLLWAARSLLWPRAWAEVERTLPIPREQVLLSDLEVVTVALAPMVLLFAAGTAVLLAQDPPWLRPHRAPAIGALLFALASSAALAMAGLQCVRRACASGRGAHVGRQSASAGPIVAVARCRWFYAMFWTPLCRGAARRTAHASALGFAALVTAAVITGAWRGQARWGMAAFAVVALVVVSRVNALSRQEIGPLLSHCSHLPLKHVMLERARAVLALVPALAGLVLLWAATTAHVALRPPVWWAFVVVSGVSWWVEVGSQPREDTSKGARWLASLAISVTLATESVA